MGKLPDNGDARKGDMNAATPIPDGLVARCDAEGRVVGYDSVPQTVVGPGGATLTQGFGVMFPATDDPETRRLHGMVAETLMPPPPTPNRAERRRRAR